MTSTKLTLETLNLGQEAEYLMAESFIRDFIQVQLLKGAFDGQLLDTLEQSPTDRQGLLALGTMDSRGLAFMLANLQQQGVIEATGDHFQLTQTFRQALQFREYLMAKIEFSNFLAPDLVQHFDTFIRSESEFMQSSRLFELFDYHRALEPSAENYAFTQRWMQLTTALTRHEAGVCLAHHDFSSYEKILDIGGNSGEFVKQICTQHAQLQATVVDLPVVCQVGADYLRSTACANRVDFYPANALVDPLPQHQCLVSFKSVLHDWPDEACEQFLRQSHLTLKPGGELLIFERSTIDFSKTPTTYGTLPTALFYRFYRAPTDYVPLLEQTGFKVLSIKRLPLETDFHMILARKV